MVIKAVEMMKFKDTSAELHREQKLLELYEHSFPAVARFVSRRGGSLDKAKDVFQDAVIVWYEKSGCLEHRITKSDEAYIFGVAKNLWYSRYAGGHKEVAREDLQLYDYAEEAVKQPSYSRVLDLLESGGRKCLEMLSAFYYHKLPMRELATSFGFRSERSATVQKYKCLEKVRETVKEKALEYEDFLD